MRLAIKSSYLPAVCLALAGLVSQAAFAVDKKAPAKPADPFLSGAPFTLEQTLKLAAQEAIPLRRRKEAIQSRGVDFTWSEKIHDQLKSAGASEELVEAIKGKARMAPIPIPKAPPAVGGLTLACAPAECEVSVNGTVRGYTAQGVMELAGVPAGNAVIDFRKAGFMSKQYVIAVGEGKTASVSALLDPGRETQYAYGKDLLAKMIAALGGEEVAQQMASVQATGSITLWGAGGASVRWGLLLRNRPDRALFEAKSGNIVHDVMFQGSEFTASKSLKGQDALELPADFGFVRDNQLAAIIAKLRGGQYKLLAPRLAPGQDEEFSLFGEGGTDKISIGFDTEWRPLRVRIATETGVGSLLVTYGDYTRVNNAWYPKTMQIKPEGRPQGIELHLDTIEISPNFKESDFKPKTRGLGNLWN